MKLWEKGILLDYDDIKNLSEAELKSYARSAVNAARKRRRDLEQAGLARYSEAYRATEQGTKLGSGQFTIPKASTTKDIRKELQRALRFLKAKTSTLEGASARKRWYAEMLGTADMDSIDQFFDLYNELFYAPRTSQAAGIAGRLAKYTGQFQKSDILVKVLWRYKEQGLDTVEQKLQEIGRKINRAERERSIS